MSGRAEPDKVKVRADLVFASDAQEKIWNNNCYANWYVSLKFIFIALHIQQIVPINKFGFKGKNVGSIRVERPHLNIWITVSSIRKTVYSF